MINESATTLALIAIVGTVITALFKLLNDNSKALVKVAESSEKVAQATTKAAKEAKDRNGHLGEQSKMIAQLITEQKTDVASVKESNIKIVQILSKSAIIAAEDRDALVHPTQNIIKQNVKLQTIEQVEK